MLIQSERVRLRTTTPEDADFVIESESDPANAPYIGQWEKERHLAALMDEDIAHFIVENNEGDSIGYLIVAGLTDANHSLCIKRIAIQTKGLGLGKATIRLALDWLFSVPPNYFFNCNAIRKASWTEITMPITIISCSSPEGRMSQLRI